MPSHSNAHPLAKLDFVTVLQHLTAGVPEEPSEGVALLPLGASKSAPNALLAIQVRRSSTLIHYRSPCL